MSDSDDKKVSPSPDLLAARSAATFGGLRWLSLLGPVLGAGILVAAHLAGPSLFLPAAAAIATVGLLFYWLIIRRAVAIYLATERRNRELLSLYRAGLAVAAELAPETVLQEIVDHARTLIDARFGALAVWVEPHRIQSFLVSGIPREHSQRMAGPPMGRGLLGAVLEGERLQVNDVQSHPRFEGFPPGHPPMNSLLAVPIHCQGPNRGSLYVCDRSDGKPFSDADADTLSRFATQAAVAIDNDYLHERIRELAAAEERLRIAHEMHDGLAQILAYVNTKALAVTEYLKNNQPDRAREHLDQLAEASRQVYADVRGHILDLRTSAAAGELNEALRDYTQKWSDQCGVDVTLALENGLRLDPELELQVLRILQEALTNVRKHASASRVEIVLQRRDRHLYGRVEDDGQGFNPLELIPTSSPRFGLATMRERATSAGGTLKIDAASQRGTRVVFDLPLTPPRAR